MFKARPSLSQASFKRIPITKGFNIVALAFDPVEKRIYWSDVSRKIINRAYLNGQGEEEIVRYDFRLFYHFNGLPQKAHSS